MVPCRTCLISRDIISGYILINTPILFNMMWKIRGNNHSVTKHIRSWYLFNFHACVCSLITGFNSLRPLGE